MRNWIPFLALMFACGGLVSAQVPQPPQPVLMPPIPPSPVDQFRQWLRMPESERENQIAGYPEEKRTVLRQKLQAYSAMPVEQRERRLTMLELRWYLRPLMGAEPEQRGAYLNMIPLRLHPVVTARLDSWDKLDAMTRKEILANDDARELVTRYFVYLKRSPASGPAIQALNPSQQAQLREKLKYWKSTTAEQRERMGQQLAAFFELPKAAQEKTLGHLSEDERREMQRTLQVFGSLSPEHRRTCVESFQRFATMSPTERAEFLRKAERWQDMTEQERETWKRLVNKLPPMPPEPPQFPPMPQANVPMLPRIGSAGSGALRTASK